MFPTSSPSCSQYRTVTPRRWPPYRDQSQPGMNHGSHGSCSARCRSRAWPRDIPNAQSARHLGRRDICCRTQLGNRGGWWPQLVRDWCKWSRDHLGPWLCFQPAGDRRWCSLDSQVNCWNIWAGFFLSHAPLQHSKLSQHLHLYDINGIMHRYYGFKNIQIKQNETWNEECANFVFTEIFRVVHGVRREKQRVLAKICRVYF